MSQPAARLGDQTVHGGTVTTGQPTVLIGGRPAARVGDMHTCPASDGPKPHVGGPISQGAPTVLIGGSPAARIGDTASCAGPPDMIATGENTVLVGSGSGSGSGAGAGTGTPHSPSYPRARLQSNGTHTTEYNPHITIEGTPEFQAQAVQYLNGMAQSSSGRGLLDSISSSGNRHTIHCDQDTGKWAWTAHPDGSREDLKKHGVTRETFSKVAPATGKQLQKKFKHARDFGINGYYTPENAEKFDRAIQRHLNSPGTKEIPGSYRGKPVTFHVDPTSGLTVIKNSKGEFLSGWKLSPQQLLHVLKDGKL